MKPTDGRPATSEVACLPVLVSSSYSILSCVPVQRDAGCGQPPTVTPLVNEGYLCPPGQEYDSLEWELAEWLIDNKVIAPS